MRFVETTKNILRPVKRRTVLWFYKLMLGLPGGPGLYYWLFCTAFATEHRVALLAKWNHLRANARNASITCDRTALEYRLRRNVHRLEKGLIMIPRRPVFALDYIRETVEIFNRLYDGLSLDLDGDASNRLARWSNDVLEDYFKVVECHPVIDRAREVFAATSLKLLGDSSARYAPITIAPDGRIASIDQFDHLAAARKSVRWYEPRRVPRDFLDRAVEIAGRSPSACNRQPYRFVIFDDPKDAAAIGAIPRGTVGFAENFPCVIVVVGDVGAYFNERDRHVIYIDASLAAMSLQFALVSMGLGCCCINWPDIRSQDRRLKEYVQLSETERFVMLISVGFPAQKGLVPYSAKKELNLVRQYSSLAGGNRLIDT